jgi:hypothetical protein
MPPLGTVIRDEPAIAALRQWIGTDLRQALQKVGAGGAAAGLAAPPPGRIR